METLGDLARHIICRLNKHPRIIIAIVGPPASGKSTLCQKLHRKINGLSGEYLCAVVPMDGFHLDNTELDKLGLRRRKGAPRTFDSLGYVQLINALKNASGDVIVPTFDRSLDVTVPAGTVVRAQHRVILTEGNYLLLDTPPWAALRDGFECSIFLDPGLDVLEKRLVDRWLKHGLNPDEAYNRAMENDLPNARLVLENSSEADFSFSQLS